MPRSPTEKPGLKQDSECHHWWLPEISTSHTATRKPDLGGIL